MVSPLPRNSVEDWLALRGRVAVVTGAASGIGAAIASSLSQAGASVALLDRDIPAAQRLADSLALRGRQAMAVACDTASETSTRDAAQHVQANLGAASILVNNAGLLRSSALADVSLEEWNQILAVNLTGYLLCARAFAPQLRKQGDGSIVNIASIAARFPQTRSGAYSASKAGILLLSRQLAAEWGQSGIRSNAICPGMIRTPLSATFYAQPGVEAARAAMTASRRVGEPEDIANAVLFLASPRAGYVNGAELMVDGGMSSMLMDMVPRPGFNHGGATQAA
ncbi:SDR family NAD(P)-dependent oxidoreductase [Kerstersia gyiorum]|uniref:2-deoxy-D-gluconate 3-dehydrogenase n=1 Tax=Kerstersia gyiorum TaxID=206506 RepID=A0A171KP52_9BURK|nr:SDR family oxidoreductase [Kerstersia gyiorum]KKO70669.1 2-deoxy-D-gluconate 3-dehydrogenase [Kerstersia gyiorum]